MDELARRIGEWGRELGFEAIGIAQTDLGAAEAGLLEWLAAGWHGEMDYMARHGRVRARPAELVPGTVRVISARLPYLPAGARPPLAALADPARGYVARYALGRDYHRIVRRRLERLARRIAGEVGAFGHRVFADSAPVMEVALAERCGLGWRGKHTLLLTREEGSFFFLGELFVDLPLPASPPASAHCGSCSACLDICPTRAIVAPYRLDARRCVSYLTIEHRGPIPPELRPLIGNRIYGCDDCQLACPWNRHARTSALPDFEPRNALDAPELAPLLGWTEEEFARRLEGSPIRRIGHERWLRNLAVALGNAPTTPAVVAALEARRTHPSPLVREHVAWALARHAGRA